MGHLILFPDQEPRSTSYHEGASEASAEAEALGGIVIAADGPPHLTGMCVDWASLTLVPNLSARRAERVERLKQLRDEHEFGLVTTPQGVLQIDERSQGRMQRALELARTFEKLTGQAFVTEWRMHDNSEVPIGVAHLEGWSLLIGAQVQHVFAHYGELYAALQSATTLEAIDAVDLERGWDLGGI